MEAGKRQSDYQRPTNWISSILRLALIALVIVLANIAVSVVVDRLEIQIWPEYMDYLDRAVLFAVILYILLMSLPFLPGVEIGLMLMIVLGPKGVLIVYFCTLIALSISFGLGRLLPPHLLVSLLQWLHFQRAATLINSFSKVTAEDRLAYLTDRISLRFVPSLLQYRYLTLALLLNLPGNFLIGGGGGIGMTAGMSKLYSYPAFLMAVSVAVLPVPVIFIFSKML